MSLRCAEADNEEIWKIIQNKKISLDVIFGTGVLWATSN